MKKLIKIGSIIGLILVVAGCNKTATPNYDAFAQCLTDKNVVMYGAFWCPHCENQKELFGDSFEFVDYVECDPRGENEQAELCIVKEIENYPTWIVNDGERVTGEQSFEDLSTLSGCPNPNGNVAEAEGVASPVPDEASTSPIEVTTEPVDEPAPEGTETTVEVTTTSQ